KGVTNMASIGINSVIGIISHIFFIAITWRLMLAVNFDVLIRKNRIGEVRLLLIFLTIAIGTLVSNFVLDIIRWTLDIPLLFLFIYLSQINCYLFEFMSNDTCFL